jgi:hypothetical protein
MHFRTCTRTRRKTPLTAKGKIRAEMETRLRAAGSAGCKVLIVRAGDFFGRSVANNRFSQALMKPGRPVSTITYPGAPGIGHQWSYLPDVSETIGPAFWKDPPTSRASQCSTWRVIGMPTARR